MSEDEDGNEKPGSHSADGGLSAATHIARDSDGREESLYLEVILSASDRVPMAVLKRWSELT